MAEPNYDSPITGVGEEAEAHEVSSYLSLAEQERYEVVDDWLLNRAYTRGHQWTFWDEEFRKLRGREFASWRKRPVVNETFTYVRVMVAKMLANEPLPTTTPATSDEEDIEIARVCDDLLLYAWRAHEMQALNVTFCMNICELGTSYWRVDWDPTAGEEIEEPINLMSIVTRGRKKVKTGDISVRAPNPFGVYTQPGALSLKDARWMLEVHLMHVDEIWERWGVSVVGSETLGRYQRQDADFRGGRTRKPNMARVVEFWEKPSKKFPKGRYLVTTEEKVLEKKNEMKRFPFVSCVFWPDPERYEGMTPFSHGRAMQREVNVNVGMLMEGREMHTFGKLFVQKGSGIKGMTTKPGEVIEYNGVGNPPQWVHGQPVSAQTYAMTDMFRGLQRGVLGLGEASLGMSSPQTSGRSVAFQAEEDNTKLGPTMMLYRSALKRLGKLMLDTWKENANYELTYAVLGENDISEVKAFEAGKIRYKDVEFQVGSALSNNKESKRQELMMLFQMGVIDQAQFAKLMEFGDVGKVYGHKDLDKQRARHEDKLLMEEDVSAMPWEDHLAHIECHLSHMKQARFYNLPPEVQARYWKHLQEHGNYVNGPGAGPSAPAQGGGQGPQDALVPGNLAAPDSASADLLNEGEQQDVAEIQGATL